jgi:hypothetical protein
MLVRNLCKGKPVSWSFVGITSILVLVGRGAPARISNPLAQGVDSPDPLLFLLLSALIDGGPDRLRASC